MKVLVIQLSLTLCDPVDCMAPSCMEFSWQRYWSSCHFLLQGIFPTQASHSGLLRCRQIFTMWATSESVPEIQCFDPDFPEPVSCKGLPLRNINIVLSPSHRQSGVSNLWHSWYKCTLSSGDNAVPCRATQDRCVTVESSDKTWSTREGNGKAYQHFCLENPMNSCLVTQTCLTLCDLVDCSTPGFSVLHHLPKFAQTHVHWVSDAIQPFHPQSAPSLPAFNLSQHQGLF